MTTPLPDPLSLPWPRATPGASVRPVHASDGDAIWAYRRLPEVVRHLSHGMLTRQAVSDRIAERTAPPDPADDRLTRGVVLEIAGVVVGDGMLRVVRDPATGIRLWIGYALDPAYWGRGLATGLATVQLGVGAELGLPVWADAFTDNPASLRVLRRIGLHPAGQQTIDGRRLDVFSTDPPGDPRANQA